MPNFDGGHYFLTVVIPVKTGLLDDDDKSFTSHAHALRSRLARMPPALQSLANEKRGINSPFALNKRTHFARLFVIEDVAFNGRTPADTLLAKLAILLAKIIPSLTKFDPLKPQHVDQLPHPYLVIVIDFDASSGSDTELDSYLAELWAGQGSDFAAVLSHCYGFDGLNSADSFARAIRACQIETTMPFNDYWRVAPDLDKLGLPLWVLLGPLVLAALASVAGLLGCVFGGGAFWRDLVCYGGIGLVLSIAWAYWVVMRNGPKPLPTAPDSDLKSVLKALYVQQNFIRFAIDTQGADAATLHAAFGTFLKAHQPENVASPTQPPGVVRSPTATA